MFRRLRDPRHHPDRWAEGSGDTESLLLAECVSWKDPSLAPLFTDGEAEARRHEVITRPDIWLGGVSWTPCQELFWVFITQWVTGTVLVLSEPSTQCKKPNSLRLGEGYGAFHPSVPKAQCGPGTFILHLVPTGLPASVPEPYKFFFASALVLLSVSLPCVFPLWIRMQKVGLYLWLNIVLKHSRNAFPYPPPHPRPFLVYTDTIDF